jgi:hypothetical protein
MPEGESRGAGRPVTVVLVALVLAACAFASAIGIAWADDGGSAATPAAASQGAPSAQPVQSTDRPRHDCPEKDGGGGDGSSGSSGSSGSPGSEQDL